MDHFNDDELKVARFILRNQELGRRGVVFIIFFVAMAIVAILAYKWLTFAGGFSREQQLSLYSTSQYIPFADLRKKQQPKDIFISTTQFVPTSPQKGDLVAILKNPNDKWMAEEVTYEFVIDGVGLGVNTVFVLPTAQKYVFEFNQSTQSSVPSVQLNIIDVSWKRVRDTSILQRLFALTVEDVVSQNNFETDQFEVTATLVNNAGYGFWSLGMPIVVSRQDRIIGVHYITIDVVKGFDRRTFSVSWPNTLSSAESVTMIPDVDVFDNSVYMPPSFNGGTSDPSGIDTIPSRR